jgi:hypothetical protein
MSDEQEPLQLFDGASVGRGLLMPTAEAITESLKAEEYPEDWFLEDKDIEKSLKGDTYKTFRRMRSPFIVNQGSIGKCNASAAIAAIHNTRMRDGMTGTLFADSHLYMNINRGVDGGSQLVDALKWLSSKGVSPVNLQVGGRTVKFPLTAFNRKQVAPAVLQAADAASMTFQTWEPYRVPVSSYERFNRAVASALARDHQIIIALHASNAFMSLDSKGYIRQGQGYGNHALIAHSAKWVGSKDDLVHPDIQNSWGPAKNPDLGRVGGQGWGEDGFGLITMRSLWQCAKTHVFWVYTGSKFNPGAA